MNMIESFTDPEIQKCPFPFIKRLHAEAPIYQDPKTGFFVVARYDDIAYVSAHPEIFSNRTEVIMGGENTPGAAEIARLYEAEGFPRFHTLVTNDPPGHNHFRAIVEKVFSPSFVKQLEPYFLQLVDELIDDFIEAGDVDMLSELCIKLPMYVVSDQLGVPRSDWRIIKKWSDASIGLINPALTAEERIKLCHVHIELQQYLARTRERYLAAPEERYFSRLAHAEVDGRKLQEAEFVQVAEQLLVAGNETTTNGIAHAIVRLIRQPELVAQIQAKPELAKNFVEEILRLHAPSPHLYRQVLQDTELSGVKIPTDSIIMLSYIAGNHDPLQYDNPDEVDLQRPGIRNHLAFGRGIHFCIGNQLARAEMRMAVERLIARLPDMHFAPGYPEPEIAAIYHVHAVENLHVAFTPSTRLAATQESVMA